MKNSISVVKMYEGQSKITELYLIIFKDDIKDKKCDYHLKVKYVMDVLFLNNYPGEASIRVARQLKIISQIDRLKISATRNIQYVF